MNVQMRNRLPSHHTVIPHNMESFRRNEFLQPFLDPSDERKYIIPFLNRQILKSRHTAAWRYQNMPGNNRRIRRKRLGQVRRCNQSAFHVC